ncbi:ribosome biogenesis GTPase Der [Nakamurella sp. YIM 132087]|uniref:GTPase Der n=1 Tax=Nakamurella alba TaxID=2665158 RepID=A0A7K1FR97_9ACTN|nr:ribosome biogenesis GTPase Der [Nakamurella alba]MTD16600.1 ribosome biogenesis GTPase Der [Nakamurella alba]
MSENDWSAGSLEPMDGTWSDEGEFTGWEDDGFDPSDEAGGEAAYVPTVAVVGRPNVGKSTLVNRLIGRREAVVQDKPGVTRDRVSYDALWNGRRFVVVDTGGWEPDPEGLQIAVAQQAERAMETTDAVVVVVDAMVGATAVDEAIARVLRRSKKPVVLVANKVDDERTMADAALLWNLGLGEPFPLSALHGRGSGDLLDKILEVMPTAPTELLGGSQGPRRVALLGKPNVGKSSLLNKLTGESRSVVDAVAGTTVDPVDSLVELDGELWRFVDTAGLRRRVNQAKGMEFYASLRTQSALEAAEVAIVLVDSAEPMAEQDQRVISMVIESGRALVIAMNKADLVDADRRSDSDRELERDLVRVPWAERINISAKTGRGVHRLAPALRTSLESWDRRIPTGRLNTWLKELIQGTPPPVRGGKQPKVLFATQASHRPPTFVLFTSGFLEAGYRRFIERRLREDFGFSGSPIRINVRVREKKAPDRRR